jgi:isoleucyl-tRNA synthetase
LFFKLKKKNSFVVAEDGRKMSKSLGNAIEPSILVNRYGAEALRYFFMSQSSQKSDMKMSESALGKI